jgi:hypothetical protein
MRNQYYQRLLALLPAEMKEGSKTLLRPVKRASSPILKNGFNAGVLFSHRTHAGNSSISIP